MKLKNMKLSKQDAKEQYGGSVMASAPEYPYGLSINLDDEALKKLGIKDLPKMGAKIQITAIAEVSSVNENKSIDGKSRQSVSLQITDMDLDEAVETDGDPGEKLYGKKADKTEPEKKGA